MTMSSRPPPPTPPPASSFRSLPRQPRLAPVVDCGDLRREGQEDYGDVDEDDLGRPRVFRRNHGDDDPDDGGRSDDEGGGASRPRDDGDGDRSDGRSGGDHGFAPADEETTTLLPPPPSWLVFGDDDAEEAAPDDVAADGTPGRGGGVVSAAEPRGVDEDSEGQGGNEEGGSRRSHPETDHPPPSSSSSPPRSSRRRGTHETRSAGAATAATTTTKGLRRRRASANGTVASAEAAAGGSGTASVRRSRSAMTEEAPDKQEGGGERDDGEDDAASAKAAAAAGEKASSSSSAKNPKASPRRSKSCPPTGALSSTAAGAEAASDQLRILASAARHHASVTLPLAARELVSTAFRRVYHRTRLAYYSSNGGIARVSRGSKGIMMGGLSSPLAAALGVPSSSYRRATDLGNAAAGYRMDAVLVIEDGCGEVLWDGRRGGGNGGGSGGEKGGTGKEGEGDGGARSSGGRGPVPELHLPPFSSLGWVDRQLVGEWRTFDANDDNDGDGARARPNGSRHDAGETNGEEEDNRPGVNNVGGSDDDLEDDDDRAYDAARTLAPRPVPRPPRENASSCYACRRPFSSATLLRHHCRLCGRSYCQDHSSWTHRLPHLGYDMDVPERVCGECKGALEARDLAERIAWRMARCRDHLAGTLAPYFETGLDTAEDAALRLARAAIAVAKSVPLLGAQATVAVETLDVLRKHGLKGVYGLILRKEFMAAADLLCRVTGIDKRAWPLSVHELSAAVFYALARHRLARGTDPEREHRIHALRRREEGGGEDAVEASAEQDGGRRDDDNRGAAAADEAVKADAKADASARAEEQAANGEKVNAGSDPTGTGKVDALSPSASGDYRQNGDVAYDDDDDDEAGDTILWGRNTTATAAASPLLLDESDAFDPLAASVADMLSLAAREAADEVERRTGINPNVILGEADAGVDGTLIVAAPRGEEEMRREGEDENNDDDGNASAIGNGNDDGASADGARGDGDGAASAPTVGRERSAAAGRCRRLPKDLASCGAATSKQRRSAASKKRFSAASKKKPKPPSTFDPVCDPVSDALLDSLLFYAPLALNFIYATSATDMQLLAAQQGWRLLYAHLEQDAGGSHSHAAGRGESSASVADRPASALFVHDDRKVACFAVRGTATINDVVTDIRAVPVPFPPESEEFADENRRRHRGGRNGGGGDGGGDGAGGDGWTAKSGGAGAPGNVDSSDGGGTPSSSDDAATAAASLDDEFDESDLDWTPVFRGQGLALCGMAGASVNLFRENVDALLLLARKGYRVRFVGHSLGGGVAALLGSLVRRHFERRVQLGDGGLLRAAAEAAASSSSFSTRATTEATTSKAERDGTKSDGRTGDGNDGNDNDNPYSAENLVRNDLLRVYSYGSPSCVDAPLADYARSYVTNVVLHDDVVPRLTPTSIRALLKHLLHVRETWVKAHLGDDVGAYAERARGAWAPRWRQSFTMLKTSTSAGGAAGMKGLRKCRRTLKRKVSGVAYGRGKGGCGSDGARASAAAAEASERATSGDEGEGEGLPPDELGRCGGEGDVWNDDDAAVSGDEVEPPTAIAASLSVLSGGDCCGGAPESSDANDQGGQVSFDGDLFYEAEENLLESEEEEEEDDDEGDDKVGDAASSFDSENTDGKCKLPSPPEPMRGRGEDDWVPFDEPAMARTRATTPHEGEDANEAAPEEKDNAKRSACGPTSPRGGTIETKTANNAKRSAADADADADATTSSPPSPPAVVLDEAPLPRMFIPGKIVHVYTHRGAYRASYVPRQFRELRRVSLAGNMLTDHTTAAYYGGLMEVKTVRGAEYEPPEWTGFGEERTCSCCASKFTWASTSDSEAQEARDKHNCRACGGLVCDPCSKERIALPTVGINVAVRVCDRCYNDVGSILMGGGGGGRRQIGGGASGTSTERSFVGGEGMIRPSVIERDYMAPSGGGGADAGSELANGAKSSNGSCGSDSLRVTGIRGGGQRAKPVADEGKRRKRSTVVDDLASRIPTVSA